MKRESYPDDTHSDCAFCQNAKPLCESHVLPAFVFKWLRGRSGQSFLRRTDNPNKRHQDGIKLQWLCIDCEQLFNRFETPFASKVFHHWVASDKIIPYDDFLLKFCTTLSWRVSRYSREHTTAGTFTLQQIELMMRAEDHWRAFIQGEVAHPDQFEQHIMKVLPVTRAAGPVPDNINSYLRGFVAFDIIHHHTEIVTFAKLGPIIITGIIGTPRDIQKRTKVRVRKGTLSSGNHHIPKYLRTYLINAAREAALVIDSTSEHERNKVEKHLLKNFDAFLSSELFETTLSDLLLLEGAEIRRKQP